MYKADIKLGFFVDVAEAKSVASFCKDNDIVPTHVLTTHKHADHCAGNGDMLKLFPSIEIVGGADDKVKACTKGVKDRETIDIHGMRVNCLHTPCHTKGHTCYFVHEDVKDDAPESFEVEREKVGKTMHIGNVNRAVFTGDTVFVGGCGHFFEGDAKDMLYAMDTIGSLPPDTKMFAGHEYTVKNYLFAKAVLPESEDVNEVAEKYKELVNSGFFTMPSLVGDEKRSNVFMRCREKDI